MLHPQYLQPGAGYRFCRQLIWLIYSMQFHRLRPYLRLLCIAAFLIFLLIPLEIGYYLVWSFGEKNAKQAFNTMVDLTMTKVDSQTRPTMPRAIHQIWMGNRQPPKRYLSCAQSWRKLSETGYTYTLWNSSSLSDFFSRYYPHFKRRWSNYKYNMNRIDTAKYFLLFTFGGIYADMDVCNLPPDPVALFRSSQYLAGSPGSEVLLVKGEPSGVNPEYMAAPPRHPFFAHALRSLYDSDRFYLLPYLYMMCVGGPCFLTGAYRRFSYPQHLLVLSYKEARGKLFDAVKGGEWYTWDSHLLISILYFGIIKGELFPMWSFVLIVLFIGLLAYFLYRHYYVKRWQKRSLLMLCCRRV